ncbi:hypothetical protein TRVL_04554 [Trypanosoma vivax]|nr:hypothetical protein TRVL_04554 [Trypanosoma vivax]
MWKAAKCLQIPTSLRAPHPSCALHHTAFVGCPPFPRPCFPLPFLCFPVRLQMFLVSSRSCANSLPSHLYPIFAASIFHGSSSNSSFGCAKCRVVHFTCSQAPLTSVHHQRHVPSRRPSVLWHLPRFPAKRLSTLAHVHSGTLWLRSRQTVLLSAAKPHSCFRCRFISISCYDFMPCACAFLWFTVVLGPFVFIRSALFRAIVVTRFLFHCSL